MGLKEALESEKGSKSRTCSVKLLVSKLSNEDALVFNTALQDESIASTTICRALKKEGHVLASQNLARHRRGECLCGTE